MEFSHASTSQVAKYIRIAPQKARLVADQIRNKPVDKALELLEFSSKKAATPIRKTALESAIANAEHNEGADIDELICQQNSCRRRAGFETLASTCQRPWQEKF